MSTLDLAFPVQGQDIPADHGYYVYSAVSASLPWLHKNAEVAIHPIRGKHIGGRKILLTKGSCLTFRISHDHLPNLLPLNGKNILILGQSIHLGIPQVIPLRATASLWSRLVIIKGFTEPDSFLGAVQRQLDALNIRALPSLIKIRGGGSFEREKGTMSPFVRRTLHIKDKSIVGYALMVTGLTADESILLQETGLGGRRHFGCGVFLPFSR